jgi:HAE1 family hydrophobic/amphiphilic exporter-1
MEYLDELEQRVKPLLPDKDIENFAKQVQPWGAEVEVQLASASERTINTFELADSIRSEVVGKVPGADVRVSAQSGLWILRRVFSTGGGSEALQVELRGYDLERARKIAQRIKSRLETLEGVAGARTGRREGRPEQNIRFLRDKISSLGLSTQEVARAVQTNLGGSRAASYRTGGEQFPIVVRLRPEDRLSVQDLDNVSIRTPDGQSVPLSTLVSTTRGRGPTEIRRINGQRGAGRGGGTRAIGARRPVAARRVLRHVRWRVPGAAEGPDRLPDRHHHGPGAHLHGDGRAVRALPRPAHRHV